MGELDDILGGIGAKFGLEIALDENGACALELEDGRVVLLQERADLNELDFVTTLGTVPTEERAWRMPSARDSSSFPALSAPERPRYAICLSQTAAHAS